MLKDKSRRRNRCLTFLIIISLAQALWAVSPASCVLGRGLCDFAWAQEQFIYDEKGRRNPFIPLVTADGRIINLEKQEKKGEILIEGIIYDKHGLSYALVNGEPVQVGDKVGDYQVLKVEQDKVIFIKEGELFAVELKKEE